MYRFLPTSKKLSRVGVGDKVGGVGQTRPRLQTISSVRVPPLYLAFDRGLGVAPVRARTRKNTPPPPPPSSSFVREIRLELFYIPRVKTPPSPFSLFFSFFSPQQTAPYRFALKTEIIETRCLPIPPFTNLQIFDRKYEFVFIRHDSCI